MSHGKGLAGIYALFVGLNLRPLSSSLSGSHQERPVWPRGISRRSHRRGKKAVKYTGSLQIQPACVLQRWLHRDQGRSTDSRHRKTRDHGVFTCFATTRGEKTRLAGLPTARCGLQQDFFLNIAKRWQLFTRQNIPRNPLGLPTNPALLR